MVDVGGKEAPRRATHNGWCFLDVFLVVVLEPLARGTRGFSRQPLQTEQSLVKDRILPRSSLELKLTNHQALALRSSSWSTPSGSNWSETMHPAARQHSLQENVSKTSRAVQPVRAISGPSHHASQAHTPAAMTVKPPQRTVSVQRTKLPKTESAASDHPRSPTIRRSDGQEASISPDHCQSR
ncbi:nephrocystin-4 isoform X1, partial [Lates japonicus]